MNEKRQNSLSRDPMTPVSRSIVIPAIPVIAIFYCCFQAKQEVESIKVNENEFSPKEAKASLIVATKQVQNRIKRVNYLVAE